MNGDLAAQQSLGVFEQEQHHAFASRRGDEAKFEIEVGGIHKGMGHQGSNSGLLGDVQSTGDGIAKQARTHALSTMVPVNCQPAQQDHGYGVLAHAFVDALGHLQRIDLPTVRL